ncbi:MAG: hypothetical protein ABSC34_08740 [Acidimicrobiales bacterium]|jgi:hypothetical protein
MRWRTDNQAMAALACIILLALMLALTLTAFSGSSRGSVQEFSPSTGGICAPSDSTDCPTLVATTKGSTSQDQVNTFLRQLFNLDTNGQPPSITPGIGLRECSSDGHGPFTISCTFWSGTSNDDLDEVQTEFIASGLFASQQLKNQ